MGPEVGGVDDVRERVSKKMAGLLRHYGPKYGVTIDEEGWARISDVVRALRRMGFSVSERLVREIALSDPKGRYEVIGDRIRARYGHSLPVRIKYEPLENPPPRLYHGTPARNLRSILARGLLPGKRLYVHLSATREQAVETGRRHGRPVVILSIDTACLARHGIPVYRASEQVYLAPRVPRDCISVEGLEG